MRMRLSRRPAPAPGHPASGLFLRRPARPRGLWTFAAVSLLAVTAATAQIAHGLDTSGNYSQEVRACREGRTAQDTPTCLREARQAEAERRRGTLDTLGSLPANALARCAVFQTPDDKEACRARIVGHAEITGSIEGGGILREAVMTVPAPPADTGMGGPEGTDEDLDTEVPEGD
jgi:hypothetical protein